MAQPQTIAGIVTFEDSQWGSASAELEALGDAVCMMFLRYLDKVYARRVSHKKLARFDEYGRVPIYKAEADGKIMIFAVEEVGLGDQKISVLFVGERGRRAIAGTNTWDGDDNEMLRTAIIGPRARVWFT